MTGTMLRLWVWATETYGFVLTIILAIYVMLLLVAIGWLIRATFVVVRQIVRRRRVRRELEASRAAQYARRFMEATHGRGIRGR